MLPAKTIRINEGAIDYIFTIYQEIEAPLPNTSKLESALLTALRSLWGGYRRIDFYALHTPAAWRLVFTLSSCSDSRSISTNLSINSTEYLTTGSGELGGIIAAFVRNSVNKLLGNQKWKIRRLHNNARPYLIEITQGLEYLRFEADDFRTVSTECGEFSLNWRAELIRRNPSEEKSSSPQSQYLVANEDSQYLGLRIFPDEVPRVQTWIEISAEIERGACQISHNGLRINNFKLDVFTLGFYNYPHATAFTIKPNIISGTILHQPGDIITFETAPIQERAVSFENAPLSNTALIREAIHGHFGIPARELLSEIQNTSGRSLIEELRGNFPCEANTGYLKKSSAIHDKSCKYFNEGAYLKCAVNPKGACEGCKDYAPNSSNETDS